MDDDVTTDVTDIHGGESSRTNEEPRRKIDNQTFSIHDKVYGIGDVLRGDIENVRNKISAMDDNIKYRILD